MLTPSEIVLFPQAVSNFQAGRQSAMARFNNPQGSFRLPSQNRENIQEDPSLKWVINLSSKPLTQAQRSVLVKGPNLVVSPRHPPNLDYITTLESVCTKLGQQDAEELRDNINRVLRSSHPPNLI